MDAESVRRLPGRGRRGLARAGVALVAVVGLVLPASPTATSAPAGLAAVRPLAAAPAAALPLPGARPVIPSQDDIARAQKAAADKAAQVAGVQASLDAAAARADAADTRLAAAAEDYDQARIALQRRTAAAATAARAASAAETELARQRRELTRIAVQQYRAGGDLGGAGMVLTAGDDTDVLDQAALLQSWAASRQQVLHQVESTRAVADMLRQQSDAAVADQTAAARNAETARTQAQQAATAAHAVQQQVNAERATLITQLATLQHTSVALQQQRQAGLQAQREAAARAAARRAAEARRRAQQAHQHRPAHPSRPGGSSNSGGSGSGGSGSGGSGGSDSGSGGSGGGADDPDPIDTGGSSEGSAAAGRRAVEWAKSQVGKPYEWGADGPDTYDCSGLTMRAWQAAGVSLSHSSRYQFRQVRKLDVNDARVGDLLFWATDTDDPDTIHHVALYAGGGMMVEAPETGLDVRVVPIRYRHLMAYAGRP